MNPQVSESYLFHKFLSKKVSNTSWDVCILFSVYWLHIYLHSWLQRLGYMGHPIVGICEFSISFLSDDFTILYVQGLLTKDA